MLIPSTEHTLNTSTQTPPYICGVGFLSRLFLGRGRVNSSRKKMKHKLDELFTNQTHFLEAISNLNERLGAIEEKFDNKIFYVVKAIINSQSMMDEIVVNNSDKIAILVKSIE